MDIQGYINKRSQLNEMILQYLDDDQIDGKTIDIEKLKEFFVKENYFEDETQFREFLEIMNRISSNYHRSPNFSNKIDSILIMFKEEFQKYLTNSEIYNVFSNCKRVLLFLVENQIMHFDSYIIDQMSCESSHYNYFINEIKPYLPEKKITKIESENPQIDQELFERYRKEGENEKNICKLIRDDKIDDFIILINQKNISLKSKIEKSIFETNPFLIENEPSLIEYAAFFGSIRIFQYLRINKVEMDPKLWLYSIHGKNPEIIHFLEEDRIQPKEENLEKIVLEGIKCHHNEIANYIINNYSNNLEDRIEYQSITSFNYEFFPKFFDNSAFDKLCASGHFSIIEKIIQEKRDFDPDFEVKRSKLDVTFLDKPLLTSIWCNNNNIANFLMNLNPKIDLNFVCCKICGHEYCSYIGVVYMIVMNNNIKMMKLLHNRKDLNVNLRYIQKNYLDDDTFIIQEETPLIKAIMFKNYEMIDLLLSHPNIDINLCDKLYDSLVDANNLDNFIQHKLKRSPLFNAIKIGDIEIVKKLLSKSEIKINHNSVYKVVNDFYRIETPLYYSIRKSKIEIVKLLSLHSKIDINKKSKIKTNEDEFEEPPLHLAIRENKIEILKLLLENPNIDVNIKSLHKEKDIEFEETALSLAIKNKNIEMIQILLSHSKIDTNIILNSTEKKLNSEKIINEQIIHKAVKTGEKSIVEIILKDSKIDINSKSISYEINNNDNVNKQIEKNTPLNIASLKNFNDIVSLLVLNEKIKINKKGTNFIDNKKHKWNSLIIAIYQKQIETCKILLSNKNIDVNSIFEISEKVSFKEKKPALFLAVENECEEIVNLLLSHSKINVNSKSLYNSLLNSEKKEKYVLHEAFQKSNINIIKKLINDDRIDLNLNSNIKIIKNDESEDEYQTTLSLAIKFGNDEIVQLLLSKRNLDINNKSLKCKASQKIWVNEENDLLETSIKSKNKEIVKLIIEYLKSNNVELLMSKIKVYIDMTEDEEIKSMLSENIEMQKS